MRWFKFYGQDFLTDSRVGALHPFQKLMWVGLLCVASQDEERTGVIKFLSEDRLMDLCGIRLEDFEGSGVKPYVTLETFCNMGLVSLPDKDTIIVTNFNRKQTEQSTSTERVREWRARKQAVSQDKQGVTHETNVTLQSNGRIEESRLDNTPCVATAPPVVESPSFEEDARPIAERRTKDKLAIYHLFSEREQPWWRHAHQKKSALTLFDIVGYDKVKAGVSFMREHADDKFCPQAATPREYEEKMPALSSYKKRNDL